MEENFAQELTSLAFVALVALLCGVLLTRFRQPAIVGYILAGVVLGPSMLGLVEDRQGVGLLAEMGVLLLLYLIGMELDLDDLKKFWRVALLTMLLQVACAVTVILILARVLGWNLGLAILVGFVLAVSSTAVAIKMLEDIGERETAVGRICIGVLIAQDLAVIPMLLIIDTMASGEFSLLGSLLIPLSIASIALLLWVLGRHRVTLPFSKAMASNVDLISLGGLTFCFLAAAASGLIGLSPAYGAFLAGLVIGNSTIGREMENAVRPVQSVLMMVFFLSIGLLLDLQFLWDNLWEVLLLLLIVTVVKTFLNVGILRLLDEPWPRAFLAGVVIGQIGEFSFLLSGAGRAEGLIADADHRLVVAVTVLSLAFSPIWLLVARRLDRIALHGITSGRETIRLLLGRRASKLAEHVAPILRRPGETSGEDKAKTEADAGSRARGRTAGTGLRHRRGRPWAVGRAGDGGGGDLGAGAGRRGADRGTGRFEKAQRPPAR